MTPERMTQIDDLLDTIDDPDQLRKVASELLDEVDDRATLSLIVTSIHADVAAHIEARTRDRRAEWMNQ